MSAELSYLLVTPYTLMKSRTGAILERLLSRCDLELVGAQILAPNAAFVSDYAAVLEKNNASCICKGKWIADYVRKNFAPAVNGGLQRCLLLLLQGESAVSKVKEVVGDFSLTVKSDSVTIRDSFSDVLVKEDGTLVYFEPGVICPNDKESAKAELALLGAFAGTSSNIVENIVKNDSCNDRTLVILKPENWRRPSVRPGAILDLFTNTGLRLVGCKMHRIPVADALEFYGPVQDALRSKLGPKIGGKAKAMLEKEFGIVLREESDILLNASIGQDFADDQFYQIVEFMSGTRPDQCKGEDLNKPGKAKCMVLIFEGENPVEKVRTVLGPTDPSKACGGTVRGEFGTNVMVNAAHASDSQESFERESRIVRITENKLAGTIEAYLA